jgi:hypothetical protein
MLRPPGRPPGRGRGGQQVAQPTILLADRELQEQAGQVVSMTVTRGGSKTLRAAGIRSTS